MNSNDIKNQLNSLLTPLNVSVMDYSEFMEGTIDPNVNADGEWFIECTECTNEALVDNDLCQDCLDGKDADAYADEITQEIDMMIGRR